MTVHWSKSLKTGSYQNNKRSLLTNKKILHRIIKSVIKSTDTIEKWYCDHLVLNFSIIFTNFISVFTRQERNQLATFNEDLLFKG